MYTNIIHNDDICNYFLKNQQFIFNSLGNCRECRTHGKRGAAGRQNRAESTAGGCLKRKYAHRKVLSRGELRLCHREWTKNPAETTGMR